jgi:hypothetical protein
MGDFARLREKLQTDAELIKREVEEYRALSEQAMQMTKAMSESVEKVRASVNRPTNGTSVIEQRDRSWLFPAHQTKR